MSGSASDLAVVQAIDTLWNPLVLSALRSALISVTGRSANVTVNADARDALGRMAVEISYHASSLRLEPSVFLDPSTGAVLESSQRPAPASAEPGATST